MEVNFAPEQEAQLAQIATKAGTDAERCGQVDRVDQSLQCKQRSVFKTDLWLTWVIAVLTLVMTATGIMAIIR
jgi:hypothetical protein